MRIHAAWATILVALAATAAGSRGLGPVPEPGIDWNPRTYECVRAVAPIVIDGRLDETAWQAARWTEDFVDIRGPLGPEPRFRTRVKMLWDDRSFYVGAEMDEPHVWATLTERDAVIYADNDFEVFIDPDGDTHEYYELEINAVGTEWDLLLIRPYRDGGPAVDAWDIQGLRTGVAVEGTVNDPRDSDAGWSVEIALPWTVLDDCAHRRSPPLDGDCWRVNFSRVEWRVEVRDGRYVKASDPATGETLVEDNWVWSPQGIVAMHYPEMWGFVRFSDAPGREPLARWEPHPRDEEAWSLRRLYYRERDLFAAQSRFTEDLDELGLGPLWGAEDGRRPAISVTPRGFEASIEAADGTLVGISEDGRVWYEDAP
jgi:hypothetical protein